jgi:hypothetical protein
MDTSDAKGKKRDEKITLCEKPLCTWTTGQEGRELRLVMECRACAKKPLEGPECIGRALEALAAEPGADSLVFAGRMETQVRPAGMAALMLLAGLANDLSHLASREDSSKECTRCRARPERLFGNMRSSLLADPSGFPGALRAAIQGLRSLPDSPPCRQCVADTSGDVSFLAERFEESVRAIVKQGFQIVV